MRHGTEGATPSQRRNDGSTVPFPPAAWARTLDRLARVYLLLVGLWILALGLFNLKYPSDWAMGDWLINYSGGFVRRGLIGEVALRFSLIHIPPLWIVLFLQWSLYAIVLFTAWRLVNGMPWRWWSLAFLFSPATLAFVLLDPPFAFRKELLLFALVALSLPGIHQPIPERTSSFRPGFVFLLTLGCAICVLSHEGLIVYFPYLFAALYLRLRNIRQAAALFALPFCVSLALFALVSHFPGSPGTAQAVCRSIGGQITSPPSGICGGAIDYLAHDAAYAHGQVVQLLQAGHYWVRVPWLFLLPLLPAALGLPQLWRTDASSARVIATSSALAWGLSVSLFYYGTDWTRWIYIHSFCLMLLMLSAVRQEKTRHPLEIPFAHTTKPPMEWLWGALLLVYCFGWELSVYGQRPLYGSFVRFLAHNMARGGQ